MANFKNVDLGKYDLNKLLRNPGLIHQIQDNLISLENDSWLGMGIKKVAKDNIKECIKMIIDQYHDNPKTIKEIVGMETLKLIEEFEGVTLADDIKDVF